MSKYKTVDSLVRKIISVVVGGNTIICKKVINTNYFLYYRMIEHLTFLSKREINYEEDIRKKILSYIPKGGIVFDIGANIGQYALTFSEKVGDQGKVYSFEPDIENFAILSLNKHVNNCQNLEILNVGIGDKNQSLEIYRDSVTGGRKSSFRLDLVENNEVSYYTKVITLADVFEQKGFPNFIKMDVEGYEKEVLSSVNEPMIKEKIVWLIEVRKDTKDEIFLKFKDSHKCLVIDDGNNIIINRSNEIPDFANLLFIPKNYE